MEAYMPYCWFAVMLLASLIESITAQLVSIWFVVAAIVSFILSLFSVFISIQLLIFAIVSIVLVIFTRPIVSRLLNSKKTRTNSDRYIGCKAVVIDTINNLQSIGQVKVCGSIWTARSLQDEIIEDGAFVKVEKIEGVKLIVTRFNDEKEDNI